MNRLNEELEILLKPILLQKNIYSTLNNDQQALIKLGV
jgi:hypothetical protein